MPVSSTTKIRWYGTSLVAIVAVVFIYKRLLPVNPTTVALTLLVLVLLSSANGGRQLAIFVALMATGVFNFFFLPPFGTFTIADTQNWIALLAFLVTALVASNLSEKARREAEEARNQRRNIERLYRLSQQLLTVENVPELMNAVPKFIADSFDLPGVALLTTSKPTIYRSSPEITFNPGTLSSTIARGESDSGEGTLYVPLRLGVKIVGALALVGASISRETTNAIGSLVGTAIERTRAIDDLTETRASQENERLRSALLDSVTHEFRTPLTSIMASVSGLTSDADLGEDRSTPLSSLSDRRYRDWWTSVFRMASAAWSICASI